jgi:hypothetical protein
MTVLSKRAFRISKPGTVDQAVQRATVATSTSLIRMPDDLTAQRPTGARRLEMSARPERHALDGDIVRFESRSVALRLSKHHASDLELPPFDSRSVML